MAHYPQSATGLQTVTYPVGPTAAATQLTSGGSAHTKGSYVELVSALGFTATAVQIVVVRTSSSQVVLLDLAIGAAGAETVVVPNLITDNWAGGASASTHHGAAHWTLPLAVPSGSRVAARCATSSASQSVWVAVTFVAAGATPGVAAFTNYGAVSGTTSGTTVDPGGTANTKGSYVELTPSTGAVTQVLVPLVGINNSSPSAAQWAVDVATGAAGAEVVLLPDLRFGTPSGASGGRLSLHALPFLTYLPAGTRIAVRASCDITDASDRLLSMAVLAATAPTESAGSSSGLSSVAYLG